MSALRAVPAILVDIKLLHSVFALPFGLVGLLLGTHGRSPGWALLGKVIAAMVCARCAAMACNRLADRRFDAGNPRTAGRVLPSGRVSPRAMLAFLGVCSVGFLLAAASLGRTCLLLAPGVLAVLLLYSFCKRVTALSHLVLGLALALSPPAAWLAARGEFGPGLAPVLLLALGVLGWVTGFDVLYACQDVGYDRRAGLYSLPARQGIERAVLVARLAHVGALAAFVAAARLAGLGLPTALALGATAALLVVEHVLVARSVPAVLAGAPDLPLPPTLFTLNGAIALLLGGVMCGELWWR